jgi:alpha-beta hydrolase superfamily lysophospholipase
MRDTPAALWLGDASRRLFAVLHAGAPRARAGLVICPPFLNEHTRSHRLFALLANALAERGISVLRFDYYGTGDSDGADADFTLASARADAITAIQYLDVRLGGVPLAAMGVRAGALPALAAAQSQRLHALWLWQPVLDGADYVADLESRDAAQRPMRAPGEPARASVLMGFPLAPGLLGELRATRAALPPATTIATTLLDAEERLHGRLGVHALALPAPLHAWIHSMDMGHFPLAPVREIGTRLADIV